MLMLSGLVTCNSIDFLILHVLSSFLSNTPSLVLTATTHDHLVTRKKLRKEPRYAKCHIHAVEISSKTFLRTTWVMRSYWMW